MKKKLIAATIAALLLAVAGIAFAALGGACQKCDCTKFTGKNGADDTICYCGHLYGFHFK